MAMGIFEVYNWCIDYTAEIQKLADHGVNASRQDVINFPANTIHAMIGMHHVDDNVVLFFEIIDTYGNEVDWSIKSAAGNYLTASQNVLPFRPAQIRAVGRYDNANKTKTTLANVLGRNTLHCYAYGV